jgi:hypothetical protein
MGFLEDITAAGNSPYVPVNMPTRVAINSV